MNRTIYVDGTSIPQSTISARLYSLYSGGATPGLLTGIAERESSYYQFVPISLYEVPSGLWPNENAANSQTPAGAYVGLMQVPNGLVDAFDYLTNTYQGWSIFNDKLSVANTCMGVEQQAYPSLPALSGSQLEQNALVIYSGNTGCATSPCYCSQFNGSLYWVPSSDGSSWVQNTSSPGKSYVQYVESHIQPRP